MPSQTLEDFLSGSLNGHSVLEAQKKTARIVSVGSAFPERSYSQEEIGAMLGIENRIVKRLLQAPHIQKRHLFLPDVDPRTGCIPAETAPDLQRKFRHGALEIGGSAIAAALRAASLSCSDVDYLMCITSTGFLVPGLSSLFSRELGFRTDIHRADLVGMGCNAGLNGLNPVVQWANNHPGKVALLVCCEVNSAMYVVEDTPGAGIVNSLFGDGASAAVVTTRALGAGHDEDARPHPLVVDFESFCIPEHWSAMRFDWNVDFGKWNFHRNWIGVLDRCLAVGSGGGLRWHPGDASHGVGECVEPSDAVFRRGLQVGADEAEFCCSA